MYVDPQTMSVEDLFPDTKTFVVNYKKISTPEPVPKHLMGCSYTCTEDYELYHNIADI